MQIWAVVNQKGGVGKTTTAVSLAGLLREAGQRPLMIDMDPHGSLTTYFKFDPDSIKKGVYSLFRNDDEKLDPASLIVIPQATPDLPLMPASIAMATLDRQLGAQSGKGLVLHKALSRLSSQYSHFIIDCPPMLGVLMVNALAACNHLIIPVQTEFLALKGLERMEHTVKMIEKSLRKDIQYTILPTMFDRRTSASVQSLRVLRNEYEGQVWSSMIPVDTHFRDASRAGLPLPNMDPRSRGAVAYRSFLNFLMKKTAGQPQEKAS